MARRATYRRSARRPRRETFGAPKTILKKPGGIGTIPKMPGISPVRPVPTPPPNKPIGPPNAPITNEPVNRPGPGAVQTPSGAATQGPGAGGASPPGVQPGGLPTLPGAQARRIAADEAYAGAGAQHDQGLYAAALALGDLGLINLLAGKGYGAQLGAAPESGEYANIARQQALNRKTVGEQRNEGGTFFSGMHTQDLSDIDQQTRIAREQALARYKEAESNLNAVLQQALADKQGAYGDAAQMEWDYAQSLPPEPQAPPSTQAPAGGGGAGGSNKGQGQGQNKKKKGKGRAISYSRRRWGFGGPRQGFGVFGNR